MSDNPRILVTLCTYNERENIELLIPEIQRFLPKADLLVIDDNSPDGTGKYVHELTQSNPQVHLIQRPGKLGLGTATVAGFQFGINGNYDYLINLDADFSHPPRFLPALLSRSSEYDIVIGSRFVDGGDSGGQGLSRQIMSQSLNIYVRLMLGLKTKDNSGSFRCYRVSRLRQVDWSQTRAKGYAIEEEILYRLKNVGATMTEVPITYEERRHGETKLQWSEAFKVAWVLCQLRLQKSKMQSQMQSQTQAQNKSESPQ